MDVRLVLNRLCGCSNYFERVAYFGGFSAGCRCPVGFHLVFGGFRLLFGGWSVDVQCNVGFYCFLADCWLRSPIFKLQVSYIYYGPDLGGPKTICQVY